ncbi:MAG TPA: selenoneine biosynthesis selenosugar synthase SenB [Gemmataceae bacterium]|nr:selenoneine biosynthesis selenosugar synthase SenB [Gemmataceae bacterium]
MNILLVTPAPSGSRKGNRVTAERWARLLRELGQHVRVAEAYHGQRCDLLIALHAYKSHASIRRFRGERPGAPLVLCLTGTDLYGDIHSRPEARESLELATRLVVLQPLGLEELPEALRGKTRIIYQSVLAPTVRVSPRRNVFEVCVLGHLRPVKDPLRTAWAARLLPASSRLRVLQVGGALSDDLAEQAQAEHAVNPRYRWLGERPRRQAVGLLARCRLLALTSELEGGANVISEAIALGVPVVSSRIAGSVGLLGTDYPGYFPFGDTQALADLLWRAETDAAFYDALCARSAQRRPLFEPARERHSWHELLRELFPNPESV